MMTVPLLRENPASPLPSPSMSVQIFVKRFNLFCVFWAVWKRVFGEILVTFCDLSQLSYHEAFVPICKHSRLNDLSVSEMRVCVKYRVLFICFLEV